MDYDLEARADAAAELAPISQGGSGQVVTLTRQTAGTYNPETGSVQGAGSATQTCSGVEDSYSAYSVAQGMVLAGDKKFLLSALTTSGAGVIPPVPGATTLTYADGTVWTVKDVETLAPAGRAVMFILQLRRGA